MCSGLLVDRRTIVTAAHCIVKKIDFVYKSMQYSTEVTPNSFYPTQESMYKIYLGMDDRSVITSGSGDIAPAMLVSIDKIIKVLLKVQVSTLKIYT
jgi:hypothetical protein